MRESHKTRGLCQGSGAAPAVWADIISICSILTSPPGVREGIQGSLSGTLCPIIYSNLRIIPLLFSVFMIQTWLLHISMNVDEVIANTQSAIKTGLPQTGLIFLFYCYWRQIPQAYQVLLLLLFFISFRWVNGTWAYKDNQPPEGFGVTVSLPNNSTVSIKHLTVPILGEDFGSYARPRSELRRKHQANLKESSS